MTDVNSRSVQRRRAAQKGLPMSDISLEEGKEMKLTLEDEIQLLLMDFEVALWKRCPKCGVYKKQNWNPNEWGKKFLELIKRR